MLVKGDETHLPNNPTTYHTTMKRTFFLLGACSLLALFSGNKASAEVIVTDCGTVYYTLDGAFSEEELMELKRDLTKSDCPDSNKKDLDKKDPDKKKDDRH